MLAPPPSSSSLRRPAQVAEGLASRIEILHASRFPNELGACELAQNTAKAFVAGLRASLVSAAKDYNAGGHPLKTLHGVSRACLQFLEAEAGYRLVKLSGSLGAFGSKQYVAFFGDPGTGAVNASRPILDALFIRDAGQFSARWKAMVAKLKPGARILPYADIDPVLYTSVQSLAAVVDIWTRGSRKVPGTFLEMLLGSLTGEMLGETRQKQISLPGVGVKIPTDIYYERSKIALATKTSSRERISQPWIHQLLIDRKLTGQGVKSAVCLVNEVQHDGRTGSVKEICVPRQIELYQTTLATIAGLYYLDPPVGYLKLNAKGVIPVRTIGDLLRGDLKAIIG